MSLVGSASICMLSLTSAGMCSRGAPVWLTANVSGGHTRIIASAEGKMVQFWSVSAPRDLQGVHHRTFYACLHELSPQQLNRVSYHGLRSRANLCTCLNTSLLHLAAPGFLVLAYECIRRWTDTTLPSVRRKFTHTGRPANGMCCHTIEYQKNVYRLSSMLN